MKHIALALLLLASPLARAQDAPDFSAERARIAADRAKAEAAFKAQERACYRKFAVTDCVNEARAKRRDAMGDLRRQELSLNDAERRRRGAERLRSIDERQTPQRQESEAKKRDQAAAGQQAREERGKAKAADRAAMAASAPGNLAARKADEERRAQSRATEQSKRVQEAADNARRQKEKAAQAEQRRKDRDKRLAERKKPVAELPTPP